MNLLFIQGGSRVKEDSEGNLYTDGNFSNSIWNRYRSLCNKLTVVLRKEEKIYASAFAKENFNSFDISNIIYVPVIDVYHPISNFFNLKKMKNLDTIIKKQVMLCDKSIIRSPGSLYCQIAVKYCQKYHKPYLVEVTGFSFDGLWYSGIKGKLLAVPEEIKLKHTLKKAKWALYVTSTALQNRYPCKGNTLGCSDVDLEEKIPQIDRCFQKKHYIIGTAAFLDVKWKGQIDVLKALAFLKKKGITNFSYELVGVGSGKQLKKAIKRYKLEDMVQIIGAKTHKEIFSWYNHIDIYVQPSYQEGLCRAIIEAMSQGCPVICSDAGGNYELIDYNFIYKKGHWKQLGKKLSEITPNTLLKESSRNHLTSTKYFQEKLDTKRMTFYKSFVSSTKNE